MKIKFQSKLMKLKARSTWHKKFIIMPRRVGEGEFQFMGYVARKIHTPDKSVSWYSPCFFREYTYKDLQQLITDKLMGKEQ